MSGSNEVKLTVDIKGTPDRTGAPPTRPQGQGGLAAGAGAGGARGGGSLLGGFVGAGGGGAGTVIAGFAIGGPVGAAIGGVIAGFNKLSNTTSGLIAKFKEAGEQLEAFSPAVAQAVAEREVRQIQFLQDQAAQQGRQFADMVRVQTDLSLAAQEIKFFLLSAIGPILLALLRIVKSLFDIVRDFTDWIRENLIPLLKLIPGMGRVIQFLERFFRGRDADAQQEIWDFLDPDNPRNRPFAEGDPREGFLAPFRNRDG